MKYFLRNRRFLRDEGGSIGLIFGLAVVPFVLMTGAALDYSRASAARSSLQNAADAAVLAVAQRSKTNSNTEALKALAESQMATMLPDSYEFAVTSVSSGGGSVKLTAEGWVPAGLSSLAGFTRLDQRVSTEAVWGTGMLEVALVLDNTGSMAEHGRMTEMKKAATALLTELQQSEVGLVKVAIVPFDVNVRVPTSYKTASWFKTDWWVPWFWKGCLTDRDQPSDANDAAVTGPSTKYPAALCSSDKLATIQPLTDNFADLYAKVNAMTPAGNTNITIGVAWGAAVLSSHEPFTEAAAPGTPDLSKIMVLMTDGANTENRWSQSASAINARTILACQAAKDAGIQMYVVRFMEGSTSLLRDCASSSHTYFDVESVEDLVPAFQAIGVSISELRVAS